MFSPSLSKEEIKKRQTVLLSLPKDLREKIVSAETAEKIYNINQKFGFDKTKQRIVAFTTGEVMLGVLKVGDFKNNLAKRLETNPEEAEKISQEIKEQIFQPVMSKINKAQEEFAKMEPEFKNQTPKKAPLPEPNKENIIDLKEKEQEKRAEEANVVNLKDKEE